MITNDLKEKMRVLKRIINFSVESDKNRKKILMLGVIVGILREGTFLAGTFLPTLIIELIINREKNLVCHNSFMCYFCISLNN